jgi:hypothetical protein
MMWDLEGAVYDWGVLVRLGDGVLEGVFGMCWSDLLGNAI